VDATDLPPEILYGQARKPAAEGFNQGKPPLDIREAIKDLDRQMVRQALALSEGDAEKAAALLGIDLPAMEKLIRDNALEGETGGGKP
jgi:DNA-binding NtrC family response regulator